MNTCVVIATHHGGLDDHVSSVFGRSPTFTQVELQNSAIANTIVFPNPHKDAPSGAGVQAAQLVASKTPCAVLAGSFGPKVASVLGQAGIPMFPVSGMSVAEAVAALLGNQLSPSAGSRATPGGGQGRGHGMSGQPRSAAGMPWAPVQTEDPQVLKQRTEQLASELENVKRRLVQLEGG